MLQTIDLRLSVVRIECDGKRGTGFLVSQEGHVLTCAHVISNVRNARLFFYDKQGSFSHECRANEVYYCEENQGDFCLLKVKEKLPYHLTALPLYYPSQSVGHSFLTYGFPDSNPLEGLEGKGILQNCDLRSEANFPIIQLEESNSINEGFSGSLIFDVQLGGIVGLIGGGVVDKKNQRQLNTSFGIPIHFIAEKCSEEYTLDVKEPNQVIELPKGFTYLKPPKVEKVSSAKIKYQDFLQSNNLPYFSRDNFYSTKGISNNFITESYIYSNLLGSESFEGGIIFGEGGIGKTRLMFEIGQMAIAFGWVVIHVKPDVIQIEDLLPFLSPKYKYLLLFDYIEDSKCFNGDIVSTLNQKNETLNIRVLANCRYTYKLSSNFPDGFLQFELKDNDNEKQYRQEVTQCIIQDLLGNIAVKNRAFFDIKPSFAVFLKFLLEKEQLESDDIRGVGDFKAWIKKRFRLTFKKVDFSELDKKIVYLISLLPLKGEAIEIIYRSGFEDICQKLKNDGWIEEVDSSREPVLKVIHDTIADELLIIHLENAGKDIKREVAQILEYSSQFNCQTNWLRSMERVIEQPVLLENNYFYDILNNHLNKTSADIIKPLKQFLLTSPVLNELDRIELLFNHIEFFREKIENLIFANSLSFALNKEKRNKTSEQKFKKIFSVWHSQNKNFNYDFNIAYRIISTYTKYFGLDEFAKNSIKEYLIYHSIKPQTSFVFQAWFENGGEIDAVRNYVLKYLDKYAEDTNARFIFRTWLYNGGEIDDVRKYVLKYLDKKAEDNNASFVFQAWFDNGGEINAIRNYVLKYLAKNAEEANASFVFQAWFDNGGEINGVRNYVLKYLAKNAEEANAQFVFGAWLNNGGEIDAVRNYVLKYLDKNAEDDNARFVFGAWLNNGGEIEAVRNYVLKYLDKHVTDANAQFVFGAWLNRGGEVDAARNYVLKYLVKNAEDPNASFVFQAWFENGGEIGPVHNYVLKYLYKNAENVNARFVFGAWLNNGGEIGTVRNYVLKYLDKNAEDANVQFVFGAWLNNNGEIDAVRKYVLKYLEKNATDDNASFVFQAWFENGGEIDPVRNYVLKYLDKNAEDGNASFVFGAWLNHVDEIGTVRNYVLKYLDKNATDANAQFVFGAWLNRGGEIGPIRNYVLKYLDKNAEDANAQFVFGAWLNNGGEVDAVRNYVLKYLDKNAEDAYARFVLGAWLSNCGEVDTVRNYVLKYLDKYAEDANASFVFQAWFVNKGDLASIKTYLIRYFDKNAMLKNTGFHLASWIRCGGKINEIETFVLEYLKINAFFAESSFILNEVLKDYSVSLEKFEPYISIFVLHNATSQTTAFVLSLWIKRKENLDIIKPFMEDFLHKNIKFEECQIVIAAWINKSREPSEVKTIIEEYLKIHSTKYKSQHVISAWLKNGGSFSIIEPFIDSYLKENAVQEYTGYVYRNWLNAGGSFDRIQKHLCLWLNEKQPSKIVDSVHLCLLKNNIVKESYKEIFDGC